MGAPGPSDGGVSSRMAVLHRRAQQLRDEGTMSVVRLFTLLRRKRFAPFGVRSAGPVTSSHTPAVVVQDDFNVVGSPSLTDEVEVTRDSDGRMRFYGRHIPPPPAGPAILVTNAIGDLVWLDAAVSDGRVLTVDSGENPPFRWV